MKKKIVRITTVPLSLNVLCRGILSGLAKDYDVLAVSSPGNELYEIGKREGVRTAGVPMQRRIAPLSDILALVRLFCLLRREHPDMVHSMTPKAGLLAMVAAWLAGVPVRVHTFTGLVFPSARGLKRRLLMLSDSVTCRCATHIIPEGEGVKRDLQRFGITKKTMRVLGHGNVRGIDLEFYCRTDSVMSAARHVRLSLGISQSAFVFVFVGRLVHDKGIDELAPAFCRVLAAHPETYLLLVGDEEGLDPLNASTQRLIDQTNHICKSRWQDDVRPWYAAADALVFPSHREGFPNVVIEACAMGLPCIVTDINGSREIIANGKNGVIVPPSDEQMLYEVMANVAQRPAILKVMAAHARQSVASRFEQGYVCQCLKDFYHEVL